MPLASHVVSVHERRVDRSGRKERGGFLPCTDPPSHQNMVFSPMFLIILIRVGAVHVHQGRSRVGGHVQSLSEKSIAAAGYGTSNCTQGEANGGAMVQGWSLVASPAA